MAKKLYRYDENGATYFAESGKSPTLARVESDGTLCFYGYHGIGLEAANVYLRAVSAAICEAEKRELAVLAALRRAKRAERKGKR